METLESGNDKNRFYSSITSVKCNPANTAISIHRDLSQLWPIKLWGNWFVLFKSPMFIVICRKLTHTMGFLIKVVILDKSWKSMSNNIPSTLRKKVNTPANPISFFLRLCKCLPWVKCIIGEIEKRLHWAI